MIGIVPSTRGDALQIVIGGLIAVAVSATWRRSGKVRLDRASGGEWRVEVAIVYELVEFGAILATRRRFRNSLNLALLVFETAQRLSAIVVESTIAA